MTPLRFRAWDKELDRMYDSGGTPMMIASFFSGHAPAIVNGKAVVMQSTSLTDKNGKEIFENDIVAFPSNEGEELAVVIYDVAIASWILAYVEGFALAGHTYHSADTLISVGNDVLEVIGNIYQNSELIS